MIAGRDAAEARFASTGARQPGQAETRPERSGQFGFMETLLCQN